MKHSDFIKTLRSDPMTFTEQQKVKDERFKLAQQIREKIGKDGKVEVIGGVFGEWLGCDGMVEEVIRPNRGGTFVKIYGCSYLFKGYPDKVKVRGLDMSKAMVSGIPREIIGKSIVLSSAVLFLFLFFRKRFIKYAEKLFDIVLERNAHYEIPENEYNVCVKEIKRAVVEALKKEHNAWTLLVGKITRFVCLFLEMDSAYRFRVQDAFGNVDKVKDFFGLIDIMISRERSKGENPTNMPRKWKFIKLVLKIILFLSPGLNRIVKRIIENLDADKIKMDEADWYFSLRYLSYDFGGKNREWRFAERDRIDKEKGHVFLL